MLTLHNNELNVYFNNFGSCIYTKKEYDENSDSFERISKKEKIIDKDSN